MGGNLPMLAGFGKVYACDAHEMALEYSADLKIAEKIEKAVLPNAPAFAQMRFDVIGIFDVLEHVEEDNEALKVLYGLLKPGGYIVLTVPAYQFLWSAHDVASQHKRRYTRQALKEKLEGLGLKVSYISYFNFFLFPAVAFVRFAKRLRYGRDNYTSDLKTTNKVLNRLLYGIFAAESLLMPKISFPFGVSIICVIRK